MLGDIVHTKEDQTLLFQIRNGSKPAFNELYRKYWKEVFNEAEKRLNDADQAKDIAQDVFTSLWLRASETPIENLPGYLFISVKNNVLRALQRQGKFHPLPELFLELESHIDRADARILYKELEQAYLALIERLPEQQRIIFKMRYHDHLTPDEIAEKLNIAPKTVRNHLGRAGSFLKESFLLHILAIYILKG